MWKTERTLTRRNVVFPPILYAPWIIDQAFWAVVYGVFVP